MITNPKTVTEYLEYFINNKCRLSKLTAGITDGTLRTYKNREKHLKGFLEFHRMSGCKPVDISIRVIREFEMYLLTEKMICNNYVMKTVHVLDTILDLALEFGDISYNPARLFKYHYIHKDDIVYLELEDIDTIISLKINKDYDLTRDYFLFGCYTGLSFSNIKGFNYRRDTFKGPDGRQWIHVKRKKTGTDCFIPLLPEAEEILKKYNYSIPSKSNQRVNDGLKIIGDNAALRQYLTSHVARKTFGNILHNELNVPLETVSKMLGHKSIKTTQSWYVRTNLKKIAHDMKDVSFAINRQQQKAA